MKEVGEMEVGREGRGKTTHFVVSHAEVQPWFDAQRHAVTFLLRTCNELGDLAEFSGAIEDLDNVEEGGVLSGVLRQQIVEACGGVRESKFLESGKGDWEMIRGWKGGGKDWRAMEWGVGSWQTSHRRALARLLHTHF